MLAFSRISQNVLPLAPELPPASRVDGGAGNAGERAARLIGRPRPKYTKQGIHKIRQTQSPADTKSGTQIRRYSKAPRAKPACAGREVEAWQNSAIQPKRRDGSQYRCWHSLGRSSGDPVRDATGIDTPDAAA